MGTIMKKIKINKEEIEELAKTHSLSEMSKKTGYKLYFLYRFCKKNNIIAKKFKRGGKNVKDISGQIFHGLKVLKRNGSNKKLALWLCLCPCGKEFTTTGSDIRQGKVKTCGCRINSKSKRNWQGYGDIPKVYWGSLVRGAEQRFIEFKITIEFAYDLYIKQNKLCSLSGLPIFFNDSTASLDRIDSTKNYTEDNVQWVHKKINKLKGTFSNNEFIECCKLVCKNNEFKKFI